jgi:4-amino-4-deoxy-L-arabinose transferase-like glycosyltransferase
VKVIFNSFEAVESETKWRVIYYVGNRSRPDCETTCCAFLFVWPVAFLLERIRTLFRMRERESFSSFFFSFFPGRPWLDLLTINNRPEVGDRKRERERKREDSFPCSLLTQNRTIQPINFNSGHHHAGPHWAMWLYCYCCC